MSELIELYLEQVKEFASTTTSEIKDGHCGEPIIWGRRLVRYVDEGLFSNLQSLGKIIYFNEGWFLIDKVLSREEAVEKYGEITKEVFGPRGGWKSVRFGEKTFISRYFKSEKQ